MDRDAKATTVGFFVVALASFVLMFVFVSWAGFFLIVSIISFVIFLLRLREPDESITNTDFHGRITKMDEATSEITLCSHGYPKFTANVWVVSGNAITTIDRKTTKIISFSSVSRVRWKKISNAWLFICEASSSARLGGHEFSTIAAIVISKEDKELGARRHYRKTNNAKGKRFGCFCTCY